MGDVNAYIGLMKMLRDRCDAYYTPYRTRSHEIAQITHTARIIPVSFQYTSDLALHAVTNRAVPSIRVL